MSHEPSKPAVAPGPQRMRMIVGIGASAGGLPALKAFFEAAPAGDGLAYVIVQHLDPNLKSEMANILGEHTRLRVVEAEEGALVEPDHVYTLPPGMQIGMSGRTLTLEERPEGRPGHFPINAFFTSLSQEQQENAVAVILSGTGTDGTNGVKEIKARGGVIFVQDPASAEQAGMPESALATGLVDVVAPAEALPGHIVGYVRHYEPAAPKEKPLEGLDEMLALLHARTGQDMSGYKSGTLTRRIRRRMGLLGLTDGERYVEALRADPAELDRLRSDVLIGVTSFFRDPEAFAALEEHVVPRLFEELGPGDELRVWVSGCSTGEEAYSIAMLLLERREALGSDARIRVFATDANDDAVTVARIGLYAEGSVVGVSPTRLARFFTEAPGSCYRVSASLRDALTFATQDLLGDPPLSHLDLVACRNVLIYIEQEVQRVLLKRLHVALRPGGFLFLGRSEHVPAESPFEQVSGRWRIFRRDGVTGHGVREIGPTRIRRHRAAHPSPHGASAAPRPREASVAETAAERLFDAYVPAAAVIDKRHHVLALHGPVEKYLNFPRGEAVLDLLAMPKEWLRRHVRTAVYRAAREGKAIRVACTAPPEEGGKSVEVCVQSLSPADPAKGILLVVFEELAQRPPLEGAPDRVPAGTASDDTYIHQLEEELGETRRQLEETNATSAGQHEELQASNEEMTSMNEELRAANEELMASKEELHALNEEAVETNAQLRGRVDALKKVTSDLHNLLVATGIATFYLDHDFRIVRATPGAQGLINFRPGDVGRPIHELTLGFEDPALLSDAQRVLDTLGPMEKEVRANDGRRYRRRIIPYRSDEDRIEGVFVTLTDVEEQRRSREAREAALQYAENIVATVREPIVILDADARLVSGNPAFYKRFRLEPGKAEGRSFFAVDHGRWDVPGLRELLTRALEGGSDIADHAVERDLDGLGRRRFLLHTRRMPEGERGPLVLLAMEDVTDKDV